MVLVDPRMLHSPLQPPVPEPLPDLLRKLDSEMEGVLRASHLGLSEKMTRYNDVLTDYLSKTRDYRGGPPPQATMPSPPSIRAPPSEVTTRSDGTRVAEEGREESGGVKESEVVGLISEKYKSKARRLLSFLSGIPGMSWTDRGELRVGGRLYPDSHIVDLVTRAVKPPSGLSVKSGATPEGWAPFADALRGANVPLDLVSSSVHREWAKGKPTFVSSPPSEGRKRRRKQRGESVSRSPLKWSPLGGGRK